MSKPSEQLAVQDPLIRYATVHDQGVWQEKASFFQDALTSKEIKIKLKIANIAGLQLADVLGHPVRHSILLHANRVEKSAALYGVRLVEAVAEKFKCNLPGGAADEYGKLLFPK